MQKLSDLDRYKQKDKGVIDPLLKISYPNFISYELFAIFVSEDTYYYVVSVKSDIVNRKYLSKFKEFAMLVVRNGTLDDSVSRYLHISAGSQPLSIVDEGYSRSYMCGGNLNIQEVLSNFYKLNSEEPYDLLMQIVTREFVKEAPVELIKKYFKDQKSSLEKIISKMKH